MVGLFDLFYFLDSAERKCAMWSECSRRCVRKCIVPIVMFCPLPRFALLVCFLSVPCRFVPLRLTVWLLRFALLACFLSGPCILVRSSEPVVLSGIVQHFC